jgi:membrane-associated phospholipid phosphatase
VEKILENVKSGDILGSSSCATEPRSDLHIPISRIALLAVFTSSIAFFYALTWVIWSGQLVAFESATLVHLHEYATPFYDHTANIICMSVTGISVCILIYLIYRRFWKKAFFWISTIGGAAIVSGIVKKMMQRDRPVLWEAAFPQHNFSFPSGHATHSMAILIAALIFLAPSKYRNSLVAAGAAYVFLVGMCRLYLGLHYPTDVLAGWALASAWVSAICFVWEVMPVER